jgi:ATP-dependent RNA helicase DDX24/MAK5
MCIPVISVRIGGSMHVDSDEEQESSKRERKSAGAKTAALKAELKVLLAQPLIARGVSARYITSGSLCIVDDIINNQRV